jgi:hypothetical protein
LAALLSSREGRPFFYYNAKGKKIFLHIRYLANKKWGAKYLGGEG